ncbi:MAG: hypothetical protein QW146_07390 [Candidatus Bathyarchaeia archaeon]
MKNKRLFILVSSYSFIVALTYSLPKGVWWTDWYSFYDYLAKHQVIPYVNLREGYPPVGFFIYMPLYYSSNGSVEVFSYLFRLVNGTLLCSTLFVLYLVFRSMVNAKRSVKLALYYAMLPSVLIANMYSNDVVALFPAVLAVYMMIKGSPLLCGLLLGVAALAKGFPFLLVIPALIAFPRIDEKIKLICATFLTIVLVSLPFLLLDPFTYISTFTHVESRGPWETVWALIDGYYSHGGLLHPYFDKFFYHFNLLKVYPASPFDHAIYKWRFSFIPLMLLIGQCVSVFIVSLIYIKRRNEIVALSGLLYIVYMLFFKGYSTQFAVSTSLYLLLAVAKDNPLPYIVSLEVSHLFQMASWGTEIIGLESLRDFHLPMLVFAILLRTFVFACTFFKGLRGWRANLKSNISHMFNSLTSWLRVFRNAITALLLIAILLSAVFCLHVLYGFEGTSTLRVYEGDITLSCTDWSTIAIKDLKVGDQVIVKLDTHTWVYADVEPNNLRVPMERGLRNPFNLKGSFNETILFFVAESSSYLLKLKMAHPAIPFRITDGFEGDLKIEILQHEKSLVFRLEDYGFDGKDGLFRMAFPLNAIVNDYFSLTLKYDVIEGQASVFFDVFSDTDDWIYVFQASGSFTLNSQSVDICGCSNLRNDKISLGAIVISVRNGYSAVIRLDEIGIRNGSQHSYVELYVYNTEIVHYQIFVENDWKLPLNYKICLKLSVILFITLTLYWLIWKPKITYSVKFCHKMRNI